MSNAHRHIHLNKNKSLKLKKGKNEVSKMYWQKDCLLLSMKFAQIQIHIPYLYTHVQTDTHTQAIKFLKRGSKKAGGLFT